MDVDFRLYGYDHDASQWVEAAVDSSGKLLVDLPSVIPVDIQAQSFSPLSVQVINPDSIRQYPRRPSGSTQIVAYNSVENNDFVLYTVSSGKTLYFTSYSLSILNTGASGPLGLFVIRTVSDVYWYFIARSILPQNDSKILTSFFVPPMEIPSGYDFWLYSSAVGCVVLGSIVGYEI
jgi:hypothetical protein